MSLRFSDLFPVPGLTGRYEASADPTPDHAYRAQVREALDYIGRQIQRAEDAGWLWYPSVRFAEAKSVALPPGPDGVSRAVLAPDTGGPFDVIIVFRPRPGMPVKPDGRQGPLLLRSLRQAYPTGAPPGHAVNDPVGKVVLPDPFKYDAHEVVHHVERILGNADDTRRPWVIAPERACDARELPQVPVPADVVKQLLRDPVAAAAWNGTWGRRPWRDRGGRVIVVRVGRPLMQEKDVTPVGVTEVVLG